MYIKSMHAIRSISLLAMLLVPLSAFASVSIGGDYFLKSAERASDDLYTIGRTATFAGVAAGDITALALNIFHVGTTTADALFIGEEIQVHGVVGDDARVVGGTVTIDGEIADDVVAVGSVVVVTPAARIMGSLYAVGGSVSILGKVYGGAKVAAERAEVSGSIAGDLEVWGEAAFEAPADIGGDFIYHRSDATEAPVNVSVVGRVIVDDGGRGGDAFFGNTFLGGLFALRILMLLALGFALFFFARERSEEVLADLMPQVGLRLLRGALIVILLGAALVLLLPTIVGIPLALVFGALLLLSFLVGSAYAGFLVGAWSERLFFKCSAFPLTYRSVLLGILFVSLMSTVPYVGPLFHILLTLSAIGSFGTMFYRHLREVR